MLLFAPLTLAKWQWYPDIDYLTGEGCEHVDVSEEPRENPFRCPLMPNGQPIVEQFNFSEIEKLCGKSDFRNPIWSCILHSDEANISRPVSITWDEYERKRLECMCILGP